MKIENITYDNLKSGELEKDLPEFYELRTVIENNSWHDHETTFNHTLAVLDELNKIISDNLNQKLIDYLDQKIEKHSRKELLFLATVFHDLGKFDTIVKDEANSYFPKHEDFSVIKTKKILERLCLSVKESDFVIKIIKMHSKVHVVTSSDNPEIDEHFNELLNSNAEYFPELLLLVWADTSSSQLNITEPQNFDFRISYYKKQLGLGI
jgi:UTP:GlnB (protein PII) uridylyltransferase